jgi:hypothetical protein
MNPFDHFAVDKGLGRRAFDVELNAAFTLDDADVERLVALQQFLAVIEAAATIEYGKRAVTEDVV